MANESWSELDNPTRERRLQSSAPAELDPIFLDASSPAVTFRRQRTGHAHAGYCAWVMCACDRASENGPDVTRKRPLIRPIVIAYQTADLVQAMGIPLTRLRVDGGATASRFLMQFQADILGVPVEAPVMSETTSLGAAYLAGLGVGLWRDPEELRLMRTEGDVYEPSMADEERRAYLKGWKAAVAATRSVSSEIKT